MARARIDLARALGAEGRVTEAREQLAGARQAMSEHGSAFEEARAVQVLAEVAERAGDTEEARERYRSALSVFIELGRPEATEVQERLRSVDGGDD